MGLELIAASTNYWKNVQRDAEYEELLVKVEQQKEELKIVRWYLDVFEDGNDTRDILNMYSALKVKFKKLEEDS